MTNEKDDLTDKMQSLSDPIIDLMEQKLIENSDPRDALMIGCSLLSYSAKVVETMIGQEGLNEILESMKKQ